MSSRDATRVSTPVHTSCSAKFLQQSNSVHGYCGLGSSMRSGLITR